MIKINKMRIPRTKSNFNRITKIIIGGSVATGVITGGIVGTYIYSVIESLTSAK
jgi:hypothetical protein